MWFMKGLMNKNKQTAHASKSFYVFFNSTECKYHTKERNIFMCEKKKKKKPIQDHYFSQFLTFSSLQMCPIGL